MSKIFPKIYLNFDIKCFHSIVFTLQGIIINCVITKQINSNKYYITTSCVLCNTYFYFYVITVIVY